jgi:hypothetical protein
MLLATIWVLAAAGAAHAQEDLGCLPEGAVREDFAAGRLSDMPNYREGPGARVQQQHPATNLSGQAKHLGGDGRQAYVFCQYSNHVGWVVMFGVPVAGTTDPITGCTTEACRAKPWWRTEYTESDPTDTKQLQVCVVERDGVVYPSTGCRFIVAQ